MKREAVHDIKKGKKLNIYILIISLVIVIAIIGVAVALFIHSKSEDKQSSEELDLGNKYIDGLEYNQAIAEFEYIITIDPLRLNVGQAAETNTTVHTENLTGQNGISNAVSTNNQSNQQMQNTSPVQEGTVLETQSETVQMSNMNTNNLNDNVIEPNEVTTFESMGTLDENGNYITPIETETDSEAQIENESLQQEIENNEEGMEVGQQQEIENNEEGMEVEQQENESDEEISGEQQTSTETEQIDENVNGENGPEGSEDAVIVEPTESESQGSTSVSESPQESNQEVIEPQETIPTEETTQETNQEAVEPQETITTTIEPQETNTDIENTQTISD